MVTMKKNISGKIDKAIKEFCELLKQQLGGKLLRTRLFGSVARGTATPESDIDILVVVENEDKLAREIVIEAAVDINLKYDVVISPIIMSAARYSGPLFQETFFYKSIQEEGIPL
ncbi:nucleotidyltransferase family protein [Moorella sp. Hama-1]|uniref:nucleotidyltransferase family protein n=1 Tax=Moorella sp. Hama-1 TaxID=2138101 RepID=UPI001F4791CC|nr:nucleotidyltransferase domain-containing protein [Moorella sp. Hama-1]